MARHLLALLALAAAAPQLAAQTTLYKIPGQYYSGWRVARAGDVNGDGYGDWIELAEGTYGVATVKSGATGAPLWSKSGYSYVAIRSIASVGDVNGDGNDDVIIGIPLYILELPWQTGSAQVLSGTDGSLLYNLTPGGGIADGMGEAVAGLGDINGDGVPDFAIAATDFNGFLRVYSGATGAPLHAFPPISNYNASLSATGDVNGDGVVDLVTGAADAETVKVYSGADWSTLYSFTGAGPNEYFGFALAGPGDVNHDGCADVLVGAPQGYVTGGLGYAQLYSGADGSVLFVESGVVAHDNFGSAVAATGDIDQDGFRDFAVSNGDNSGPGSATAKYVKVYSGRNGHLLVSIANPESTPSYSGFGYSIDGDVDVNGDGYPDLVVGAPYSKLGGTPGGLPSGTVFVFGLVPGLADYGIGTPGCSGPEAMNAVGVPKVGNATFLLRCGSAPPLSLGLALVCDAQDLAGSDTFGLGVKLHVDLVTATDLLAIDILSDSNGVGRAPAPIPANPFLAGKTYYAQALWLWSPSTCTPSTFGLSTSNGLAITILP